LLADTPHIVSIEATGHNKVQGRYKLFVLFSRILMLAVDCPRPSTLYQYADRPSLTLALTLGEFRLQPAAPDADSVAPASNQILPFRRKQTSAGLPGSYLTLRLTQVWDEKLFETESGPDCCLIIHDAEQFGERIHRAAQQALPNWAGIDAAVSYGIPSPLGAAFSKGRPLAKEKEWLFAWRPIEPMLSVHPVVIRIGSIEAIAELRSRGH
jgi:hypothetical protein